MTLLQSKKGEQHVDNLQESRVYLRGSCGCGGVLRDAYIGRTFGYFGRRAVC